MNLVTAMDIGRVVQGGILGQLKAFGLSVVKAIMFHKLFLPFTNIPAHTHGNCFPLS